MRSKWQACVAISLASLTLSGCAAPLIAGLTIAEISAGATVASVVFTGKGTSDHLMDMATGKDCRFVEGILREGRDICVEPRSETTSTDFKGLIPVQLAMTGTSPPPFNDGEATAHAHPVRAAAQIDPVVTADRGDAVFKTAPQVTKPVPTLPTLAQPSANNPPTSVSAITLDPDLVSSTPTVAPVPKIEQQRVFRGAVIPVQYPALFDGPLPVARPAANVQTDGLPSPVERPTEQITGGDAVTTTTNQHTS
jgi:hypothetical protein